MMRKNKSIFRNQTVVAAICLLVLLSISAIAESDFLIRGYVQDYQMAKDSKHSWIRVYLKYSDHGEPVIRGIRRVSTPGRRVYAKGSAIPIVKGGLGISIVSSSKGILSWKEAKGQNVGGEVIGIVW